MNRKKLVLGLWIGAGTLAAGAAAYFGAKRYGGFGGVLGRALGRGQAAPPPPLVAQRRVGDATVSLYRAPNIPIDQRVGLIQKRVWDGVTDPRIRKLALELTHGCPRNDGVCESKRIFEAVARRIRYTGDVAPVVHPDGSVDAIDYFQKPWRTWEFRGGDCDDHAGLISALTSSIGIPTQLRVTAPTKFGDYSHIYPVVGLPKTGPRKWTAVDTTLPGPRFAKEAPFGRKKDYAV